MKQIINSLKGNPIFRMSLGAKELFHSNFLEYLWELDNELFIEMMNQFIPEKKCLPSRDEYKMGRELENFDICIYKEKKDYQLIIENKVKSIPYKEQLNEYVKKAEHAPNCRFVLLTLSKDFSDITAIQNWIILGYDNLCEGIKKHYLKSEKINEKDQCYILDYCSFIEQLNKLKTDVILPETIMEQKLYEEDKIKELKKIRLHDLYIKVRSSWFLSKLKNKLEQKHIKPIVVHKYNEIYATYKQKGVYLNVDVNQGTGQIASWIYNKDGIDGNTFEIVIQGSQFRHGISQRHIETPGAKNRFERLNILYKRLNDEHLNDASAFLNFNSIDSVKPEKAGTFRKANGLGLTKSGPFCFYDDSYIYRYVEVGKLTVGELLTMMSDDIEKCYFNIPSL